MDLIWSSSGVVELVGSGAHLELVGSSGARREWSSSGTRREWSSSGARQEERVELVGSGALLEPRHLQRTLMGSMGSRSPFLAHFLFATASGCRSVLNDPMRAGVIFSALHGRPLVQIGSGVVEE